MLLVMLSALVIAFLRMGVFSLIGVLDQARSRGEWLNVLLGTVSVATVPEGRSRSYLLSGGTLFNHIKIYDDKRTTAQIVNFIGEIPNKILV